MRTLSNVFYFYIQFFVLTGLILSFFLTRYVCEPLRDPQIFMELMKKNMGNESEAHPSFQPINKADNRLDTSTLFLRNFYECWKRGSVLNMVIERQPILLDIEEKLDAILLKVFTTISLDDLNITRALDQLKQDMSNLTLSSPKFYEFVVKKVRPVLSKRIHTDTIVTINETKNNYLVIITDLKYYQTKDLNLYSIMANMIRNMETMIDYLDVVMNKMMIINDLAFNVSTIKYLSENRSTFDRGLVAIDKLNPESILQIIYLKTKEEIIMNIELLGKDNRFSCSLLFDRLEISIDHYCLTVLDLFKRMLQCILAVVLLYIPLGCLSYRLARRFLTLDVDEYPNLKYENVKRYSIKYYNKSMQMKNEKLQYVRSKFGNRDDGAFPKIEKSENSAHDKRLAKPVEKKFEEGKLTPLDSNGQKSKLTSIDPNGKNCKDDESVRDSRSMTNIGNELLLKASTSPDRSNMPNFMKSIMDFGNRQVEKIMGNSNKKNKTSKSTAIRHSIGKSGQNSEHSIEKDAKHITPSHSKIWLNAKFLSFRSWVRNF
ncbi:unnamed protein product [Gordionus sp. m RMFG-2023]